MALNDKNLIITPNIGSTNDPKVDFIAASASTGPSTITATIYPTNNGTLSFDGTEGSLFSISNNLSTGSIFSVNPISGIPIIDVNADRTIALNPYGGNTGIGTTNPSQKLHVAGNLRVTGAIYDSNNSAGTNGQVLKSTGVGVTWVSGSGSAIDADTLDGLNSTQFVRSDFDTTLSAHYTFTNTDGSPKLVMSGHSGAANYNYFLNASNDTGIKAVHFVNGSTRVGDGGANAYVIRNDAGSLILGRTEYATAINGSTITGSTNIDAPAFRDSANTAYYLDPANTGTSLNVAGSLSGTQLISTIPIGTAPLTVTSTTKVANLNADLLDGIDSGSFLRSDANDDFSGTLRYTGTTTAFDFTSTAEVILADHSSNSTPVPFDIRKSGSTLSDVADYGVLHLSRLNHNNAATTAGASLYFQLKDSAGTLREYAGIAGQKTEAGAAGGRLQFFRYNRTSLGYWDSTGLYVGTDKVWHAGNDGTTSGLDADLLDGKNTGTSGNTIPLLDGANTWSGSQTFSSQIVSLRANSTTTGDGQIYLNGATGNRIDFNTNGVAAPAFTTRSAGTKLVLYPNIGASSVDYALGIEGSTLWSSVPTTTEQFKWYGGTTLAATLTGAGTFSVIGQLISTRANSTTTGGGQIYLNGATGNRIDFAAGGYATPATTTRSVGTKIVLDPGVTASSVDYALGIENTALWSSIPSSVSQFKWYASTTNIATLFGTGQLVIGTTSLTGTTNQNLQVNGGTYISGIVGVGITNPVAKLDIFNGTTADANPELRIGGYGYIDFHNRAGVGNYNPIVQADDKSIIFTDGSVGTGNLVIAPWSNTTAGIRITSAGNVGVNVATPGSLFDVRGTTDGQQILQISNTAGASDGGATNALRFTCNGNTNWAIARYNAFAHIWGFGGTNVPTSEAMRIASNGNVGISTNNPLQKLDVRGNFLLAADATTANHITQKPYTTNNGTLSWEGSAGQLFSITNNLTTGSIFSVNDVSGIPSIDVDANGTIELAPFGGNIGVGTVTPTTKVDVFGNVKINSNVGASGANTIASMNGRLLFDTDFSDIARGPNKIELLNNGVGFVAGFGVHSDTVSYYSGETHKWYRSTSQTAFTEVMTLSNAGALVTLSTIDATAFRDSANTAFYLDPANTGTSLNIAGSITLGAASSGATATPAKLDTGNTVSNGTTRDKCKIYLYNSGTEQYGFSIGNSGDVQYHSNTTHDFYIGNTKIAAVNSSSLAVTGSGSFSTSVSSPTHNITADTNNRFQQGLLALRSNAPTIYFRDTDHNSAMLHCNSNEFYILRGTGDTETWSTVDGVWPLTINLSNNDATFGRTVSSNSYQNILHFSANWRNDGVTALGSSYNYIMSAANDTGNKLVMFVNSSTRTADGGASGLTFRNDGGPLNLGSASYTTNIVGSSITGNVSIDAPSFRDSANTAFYLDPANTGTSLNVAGVIIGAGNVSAWNTTTPGTGVGGLHLGAASGTGNAGPAITFGARDTSSGGNAQAGIYINSDGTYGTRMYFATSDNYTTGSKVAMSIDQAGAVSITRSNLTVAGTVKGNQVIGGTGSAIGSAGLIVNGTTGDNDSQLIIKKPSQSSFSVLSWDGQVFLSANVYYENSAWVHSAPTSNTNSSMLVFNPGTGVQWYASSNSSSTWNVAGGTTLWNDSGVWQRSLSNTLTLTTSGTGLSGSTSYNNSGAATFTVTSNAQSTLGANTIVSRDASNNFSAGNITATNLSDATGTYNVNLGSGGSEGRGLVAGYSGGSYGGIGYNVRHTTTGATWIAPSADTSSYLLFNNAGFTFYGAAGGAVGRTLSYTTLATIGNTGNVDAALFRDSANTAYYLDPANTGTSLSIAGNTIVNADGSTLYGPNTTWGQYLRVGGNGGSADATNASVTTTNGNLHLDSRTGGYAAYLNYYKGTAGVAFGNGASGIVAWMGPDGDLWKGGADNSGSVYWHAGNDGSGSGLDADLLDGVDSVTRSASHRANRIISGGGTITVDASYNVLWSTRFIIISNGNGGNFAASGYFDITCPTTGTITGVGGAANQTATAAGIPLPTWNALYYILPIGSANTSLAANFRVASYTSALDIPHNWVLICVRNGDDGVVTFNNGIVLSAGQSLTSAQQATANTTNTLVRRDASGNFTAGTITATLSGNASTASNLTGTGANWSTNGRITATVGELAWKNYGNNHVIFDASASTAPNYGTSPAKAISNTNAEIAWSSTYPTLMGWNGVNTYGVRVDSARVSDITSNISNTGTVTLASATESNSIYITAPAYVTDQPVKLLNFDWYGNVWSLGNIRSGGVASNGFGVYSSGTERARFTTSGITISGTYTSTVPTGTAPLSVTSTTKVTNLNADLLDDLNAATTGANTIVRTDGSGNIAASGNVTAYSSDRRLKENLNHIESPIEKIQKLNGYTFDWNEKSKELGFVPKHEKNDIGLIAQEVEEVLPQATARAPFDLDDNGESKSGENYLTIQYERLVPLLVEAIKEQQNQIADQQNQINDLKNQLNNLNK